MKIIFAFICLFVSLPLFAFKEQVLLESELSIWPMGLKIEKDKIIHQVFNGAEGSFEYTYRYDKATDKFNSTKKVIPENDKTYYGFKPAEELKSKKINYLNTSDRVLFFSIEFNNKNAGIPCNLFLTDSQDVEDSWYNFDQPNANIIKANRILHLIIQNSSTKKIDLDKIVELNSGNDESIINGAGLMVISQNKKDYLIVFFFEKPLAPGAPYFYRIYEIPKYSLVYERREKDAFETRHGYYSQSHLIKPLAIDFNDDGIFEYIFFSTGVGFNGFKIIRFIE